MSRATVFRLLLCGAACVAPVAARAHSFDERYDLPAPLAYFIAGAAAAVGLSFVIAILFARRAPPASLRPQRVVAPGCLVPVLRACAAALGLFLFVLTIVSGLFGTADPMMNLAPTLVWIAGWVGLSLAVAAIGNIWPALDPWRTLFGVIESVARRLGRLNGVALNWRYPRALGAWPAVGLLLAIAWFELADPRAAAPSHLAHVLLWWSALTLAGMACFGRAAWQSNADVFSIYFSTLGRFAPIAGGPDARSLVLRIPGRGLLEAGATTPAMAAFVLAMLATVLFDGLLSGSVWQFIQHELTHALPFADNAGYLIGAIGLLGVWLLFFAAYVLTCRITALVARGRGTLTIARTFAYTMVPIAVGYNVAHNFSSLIVQGQQLIPLLADPLGFKWNLPGAAFRPAGGMIDARMAWYVAIGAIVGGHAISIWLAHRIALREFGAPRRAVLAALPLTVLMMIYTAVSLSVIAAPMVKFDTANDAASER